MARRVKVSKSDSVSNPPKTITLERVIESGILMTDNEVIELGIAKSGGRWFKDKITSICYRVDELNGGLSVMETREMKKTPRPDTPATDEIKCCDCSGKRVVKAQDTFQVKRCVGCQKKYRNKKRAERQKAKRAEKSKSKLLDNLNGDLKVE